MPKKRRTDTSDASDEEKDYRDKRKRNNEAVKKSRFKSKQRTQETFTRVSKLKEDNKVLEEKVKMLTRELQCLKDLFLAHAANKSQASLGGMDLQKLLDDIPDDKDQSNK
ncbi:CCAAT/enhancer-binding protein gamma [Plodia interpunctella]|uniref:CCAAT/enhancer-binding protein gamma n=1 Tax=Plodia interpunctella TaxID=58824 RepID=UPI0023675CED|nr:CCAAT/enhancer-binding protein gamma [Plodia interpunctella]XP_053618210.1 CCAAT/enhancer-binding protein gamma [Plodia interpunctella]